ncbi:MAG TPA: cytochrome c-type biogenesis protein [Gaiella sp.]|nr:cytochrome c-type biogenesis protein [Gaiella sp.]
MTRALALCALVAALVAGTATAAPSPADLESELVCPVCGTTLDQSDAPIALKMKRYIRQRLAAGASEKQIKAELVDQFGPGVLAEPPKSGFDLLAWLVPLGVLVAGAVGVGLVAWGWSRRRGEEADDEPVALDPELERRVDAELQRFES